MDGDPDVRALRVAEADSAPPESRKTESRLPLAADERNRPRKPGTYEVYVSVGTATGTPKIALPLPADDGHHRYRLGKLVIAAGDSR